MPSEPSKILFPVPNLGNHCGILSSATEVIAEEFKRRQWEVSIISSERPDFLTQLCRFGSDPEAIIYFGVFLYDLRFSAQNHFKDQHLNDLLQCRTLCTLGDHPISNFMWERVLHMSPSTIALSGVPSFFDEAQILQPKLHRFHNAGPTVSYVQKTTPIPFENRPIDLLVPLSFDPGPGIKDVTAQLTPGSEARKFAEAFYEVQRSNRQIPILPTAKPIIEDIFGIALDTPVQDRQLLFNILSLISTLDSIIRRDRRSEFLLDLLRETEGRRICVIDRGLPDHLKSNQVSYIKPLPAPQLGQLMKKSKLVAHVHPTYPDGLHDRILNTMGASAVLLTDYVPALAESFEENKEWIHARPKESLNQIIERIGEARLPAIATQSYEKVWEDFGPRKCVSKILQAVN